MTALRVKPPAKEKEGRRKMEQKKLEELLSQSMAILVEVGPRFGLTIAMLMAHITEK